MRRSSALARVTAVACAAALLAACGTSSAPHTSQRAAPMRTYPPVPAGGTDCGITDEMSGLPTTTMAGTEIYTCLTGALGAGTPARLVVIQPSTVLSGRTTGDGYSIPAGILITYRVLGANRLEVTTDRHEAGGAVTTRNCTGLVPPSPGSPPTPTGCTPA